jgi:molybdenum cofactor cytidylyltransferase
MRVMNPANAEPAVNHTSSAPTTGALILAAGASTRLGQPKQLIQIPYRDGHETLLHRTARLTLEAGCATVVIVLGACDHPCRETLKTLPNLILLHNENWRAGMGATLSLGIAAFQNLPHIHSVLVTVTDQPHLTANSFSRLLTAHHQATTPATAAFYANRPGVPAIFRRTLFPTLAALTADQGARSLLTHLGPQLTTLPLPEAAFDLDTPADLRTLTGNDPRPPTREAVTS